MTSTAAKPLTIDQLAAEKVRRRSLQTLRALMGVRLANFGLIVIVGFVILAVFAPLIAPYDPIDTQAGKSLDPPSMQHWLGVDQTGRDVLSRLIYGSRVALGVSIGAVTLGALIGTPMGLFAAFFRGWVDSLIMRIIDAIICFPGLIVAVGLASALGPSWTNLIIAIGIGNVPWVARIVRSKALSVREQDHVLAARALGASTPRIVLVHIWPNCTAPVIVAMSVGMAAAVLAESGLSFIGVGVSPPTPTWGSMLQFAFGLMRMAPWLSIFPGIAIFLLVLAFNFVGDALRDVLDPRLKGVLH